MSGAPVSGSVVAMFIETITQETDDWYEWSRLIRLTEDSPDALVASFAGASNDGTMTGVNVWESPGAISDFYVGRLLPIIQERGEPDARRQRHGAAMAAYVRS